MYNWRGIDGQWWRRRERNNVKLVQVYWLQLQSASSIIPDPSCEPESVSRKPQRQLHRQERGGESGRAGQSHPSSQTTDREQAQGENREQTAQQLAKNQTYTSRTAENFCWSKAQLNKLFAVKCPESWMISACMRQSYDLTVTCHDSDREWDT